ncbi:MAG TPA: bifunctional riboflavin kinase/FAD synthetase [Polyangia bacterium]|nr:bifunctional riboflavin kinase/FAD synthetase [Polyangia bacterium]
MRVFQSAAAFAAARTSGSPPTAVAIGNFDGVHLGHQALLAEARRRARSPESALALTFMPHPARLLAPAKAPPLIMPLQRRLTLLAEAGAGTVVIQPFTPEFAAVEADDFVRRVLARELGAADVVVGFDFSFGRGRAGNVQRLESLGAALGMGVAVIPPVSVDGLPCSSTRVRALVTAGDMRRAASLLGRPFELEGVVVRGAARGRSLGFPTANLACETELGPRLGIYAARVRLVDGPDDATAHLAAVSVGRNPTFTGPDAPVIVEAHLLDFTGDLYGRRLRLEMIDRLRDEQKFDSVEALVTQIGADVARVRALMS